MVNPCDECGVCVDSLHRIQINSQDVVKFLLRIVAEFGFMVYAMHDNVNWMRAINVINVEHQPIKDRQTYFRLTGVRIPSNQTIRLSGFLLLRPLQNFCTGFF